MRPDRTSSAGREDRRTPIPSLSDDGVFGRGHRLEAGWHAAAQLHQHAPGERSVQPVDALHGGIDRRMFQQGSAQIVDQLAWRPADEVAVGRLELHGIGRRRVVHIDSDLE